MTVRLPLHISQCLLLLMLVAAILSGGCRKSAPTTTTKAASTQGKTKQGAGASTGPSKEANDKHAGEDSEKTPAEKAGAASQTLTGKRFTNVTDRAKLRFAYSNGRDAGEYAILESLGGGVGVFDFDRDGNMDLMFAGGGSLDNRQVRGKPCVLFHNQGDHFRQVTEFAGVAGGRWYQHGIFPADYDNDGFPDIAVSGYGGIQLFHNEGDGTFTEVAAPQDTRWSTSLAWGDFNGDGVLDLYVPHYVNWSWENHPDCFSGTPSKREVCAPRDFRDVSDNIYYGQGDGSFVDRTQEAGLKPDGKGLGAVAVDVDLDGDTDLYVANDTTDNFLYLNNGKGEFTEEGIVNGVSGDDAGVNTGSMGIAVADANQDGLPDIWVTNFERELFAMYRNEGSGFFTHVSRASGLAALGGLYVGFGTTFIDMDLDGDQDVVVSNGHVSYRSSHSPYLQQPVLLENNGEGRFFRINDEGGYFDGAYSGRGVARVDWNNDGAWDLVFNHSEQPVALLESQPPAQDRWAQVQLVGVASNRDGVGATITLENGTRKLAISRVGGASYLSQDDPRLLLVAPSAESRPQEGNIVVKWPSGASERFPFPTYQTHQTWVEGSGQPVSP